MQTLFGTSPLTNRPWLAAGFLMLGAFMNILDATVVNLALPAIRDDLSADPSALQWVLVIYILTFAAGLLPFGRFGDIYGRRRVFVLGLLGFMATSLAAGIAPDVRSLIVARGAQGLAAAAMAPQVLAIIHTLFTQEDRGKAIGLFGMVNGLGAVAGPVVGGLVISADLFGLGWRPIFLINLPLGLIALAGAMPFLPEQNDRAAGRADRLGAACFAIAISSMVYPLIEGRNFGWSLWLLVFPVLAATFAFAFWRRQQWLAAKRYMQTLPIGLMRDRGYVIGIGSVMVMISGLAGTIVVLAVFLQTGLDLSPAAAGLAIAPHPVSAMIASLASGRFGSRWLRLRVLAGVLTLLMGLFWLRIVSGHATTGVDFLGPLILFGSGGGTAFVALFQLTMARISGPDAGAGSGALQAFQQVGIALGIAVVGQLFFGRLGANINPDTYRAAFATALIYPIVAVAGLSFFSLHSFLTERTER